MTHQFNIEIIDSKIHFKAIYRNKKFRRIELLRGKLTKPILKAIGRIIPFHIDDFSTYNVEFQGKVNYTIINQEKSLYSQFNEEWHSFYENFAGVPPKFTAADGKSLKGVIGYLKKISTNDNEALELWKLILDKWDGLSDFHKSNTDLKYINSKLNVLINAIKQKNNTNVSGTNYSVEL